MTWVEANLSLQVAAEERFGSVLRERQRIARELEDARFSQEAGVLDGPG